MRRNRFLIEVTKEGYPPSDSEAAAAVRGGIPPHAGCGSCCGAQGTPPQGSGQVLLQQGYPPSAAKDQLLLLFLWYPFSSV